MDNLEQSNANYSDSDINNTNFYNIVTHEIESDKAVLQKNLQVMYNLRLEAAELEVEAAALYHAELWRFLESMKITVSNK